MMVRRLLKRIIPVFFVCVLIEGCSTEKICNETVYSYLQLHFYTVYKTNGVTHVADSTLTSIKFTTDQFIDTANSASTISIPLLQDADSVAFVMNINSMATDLVYVKYTRSRVFINYDCGFRTDFKIDTLVSMNHSFDSIQIVQPKVTDTDEDHIKIFFNRPANVSSL